MSRNQTHAPLFPSRIGKGLDTFYLGQRLGARRVAPDLNLQGKAKCGWIFLQLWELGRVDRPERESNLIMFCFCISVGGAPPVTVPVSHLRPAIAAAADLLIFRQMILG